ncbi:hypothetical protein ACF073_39985, partial [Streptomyces sp. NPDC015171]|uniref:hypothetical protein n=1 Tax=Streptomyces sp. NPDC015171 TaxID=3364945 RepID=UPI0036F8BAA1
MLHHQEPRHHSTQTTRTTGDQDHTLRIKPRHHSPTGRHPHQTRHPHLTRTHRRLRLTRHHSRHHRIH